MIKILWVVLGFGLLGLFSVYSSIISSGADGLGGFFVLLLSGAAVVVSTVWLATYYGRKFLGKYAYILPGICLVLFIIVLYKNFAPQSGTELVPEEFYSESL